MENVIITLPSGAKLEITPAPFPQANALYKAVLAEGVKVKIEGFDSVENAIKDAFCIAMSSPLIESCVKACMARATYKGLKITDETFEPMDARADYTEVFSAVMKETLKPFTKSLYAQFKEALDQLKGAAGVPA